MESTSGWITGPGTAKSSFPPLLNMWMARSKIRLFVLHAHPPRKFSESNMATKSSLFVFSSRSLSYWPSSSPVLRMSSTVKKTTTNNWFFYHYPQTDKSTLGIDRLCLLQSRCLVLSRNAFSSRWERERLRDETKQRLWRRLGQTWTDQWIASSQPLIGMSRYAPPIYLNIYLFKMFSMYLKWMVIRVTNMAIFDEWIDKIIMFRNISNIFQTW